MRAAPILPFPRIEVYAMYQTEPKVPPSEPPSEVQQRREAYCLAHASPANRNLRAIAVKMVETAKMIDRWLAKHADDCDCPFCGGFAQHESRYIFDALAGHRWSISAAFSVIDGGIVGASLPDCPHRAAS